MQNAVDAVLAGRIDPWPLLTHQYALGELDADSTTPSTAPTDS